MSPFLLLWTDIFNGRPSGLPFSFVLPVHKLAIQGYTYGLTSDFYSLWFENS